MAVFLEQTVLLLGSLHALILSIFLFKQSAKNPANRYIGLFTNTFALVLLSIFIDTAGLLYVYPHLIGVHEWLIPALGPLLYLYALKLTAQEASQKYWLHFLPSAVIALLSIEFLLQSSAMKIQFISPHTELGAINEQFEFLVDTVIPAFSLLQITCYLLLIFRILKRHTINIESQFSYLEKVNLSWLMWLSKFISVLLVLWLIDELIELNIRLCFDSGDGVMCHLSWFAQERHFYPSEMGVILCVYAITYYALKQPAIFYPQQPNPAPPLHLGAQIPSNTRYANSNLSEQLAKQLFQELDKQVRQQQLYINPTLTLDELAQATGWSRHQLSQAINQVSGKNFFDYINMLRINDAKHLLLQQPQKTVLDIALETGFNSRSAFYNAFKKYAQQTPSEYRKAPPIAS
ncbi:hypothetical protein PA25_01490 [Pseudoalteromonas sp. A25]|uniref:AraC family transcriptional regulator n=1 Tax=Pseudoalteromonas sp. A25 TaxID=116092 RepID=UPI001260488D|nr:helix-turn-helix domain-containing protein [Pseudoalteromonas sp. A25]BBN80164.1 hypothetical protein PA25_01490 [Pseudoalteromonas sp. A25]